MNPAQRLLLQRHVVSLVSLAAVAALLITPNTVWERIAFSVAVEAQTSVAPVLVSATVQPPRDIKVVWTYGGTGHKGFEIYRKPAGQPDVQYKKVGAPKKDKRQMVDGLRGSEVPGTYTYRLRAVYPNKGFSGYSNAVTVAIGTPPEQCNGLDDDGDGSVDEGIPNGAACDGADADSCNEGVLVCNASTSGHFVCSDANDADPELCSNSTDDDCDDIINEACAVTLNPPAGSCNGTAPRVSLSWTASSDRTAYTVQRQSPSGVWADVVTVTATAYTDADPALVPTTSYGYRIRTAHQQGAPTLSNVRTVTTPSCAPATCNITDPLTSRLSKVTVDITSIADEVYTAGEWDYHPLRAAVTPDGRTLVAWTGNEATFCANDGAKAGQPCQNNGDCWDGFGGTCEVRQCRNIDPGSLSCTADAECRPEHFSYCVPTGEAGGIPRCTSNGYGGDREGQICTNDAFCRPEGVCAPGPVREDLERNPDGIVHVTLIDDDGTIVRNTNVAGRQVAGLVARDTEYALTVYRVSTKLDANGIPYRADQLFLVRIDAATGGVLSTTEIVFGLDEAASDDTFGFSDYSAGRLAWTGTHYIAVFPANAGLFHQVTRSAIVSVDGPTPVLVASCTGTSCNTPDAARRDAGDSSHDFDTRLAFNDNGRYLGLVTRGDAAPPALHFGSCRQGAGAVCADLIAVGSCSGSQDDVRRSGGLVPEPGGFLFSFAAPRNGNRTDIGVVHLPEMPASRCTVPTPTWLTSTSGVHEDAPHLAAFGPGYLAGWRTRPGDGQGVDEVNGYNTQYYLMELDSNGSPAGAAQEITSLSAWFSDRDDFITYPDGDTGWVWVPERIVPRVRLPNGSLPRSTRLQIVRVDACR
jgi:hypothetical protein